MAELEAPRQPRAPLRLLRQRGGLLPRKQPNVPPLLPPFPGVDGGKHGHWGNQNEEVWADDRWNRPSVGPSRGVFHGPGLVVPKGVCVRLGDKGELAACFNPDTLCYEASGKATSSRSPRSATASWTAS